MKNLEHTDKWSVADPHLFWGEIAPTEHIVQIYENDDIFLDLLEGFVINGLKSGDCVVIIATETHIDHLNFRLAGAGIDIDAVVADGQYIPLDAEQALSEFMVNGWPDAKLFYKTISRIVNRAKQKDRRLRAFGEMVAILWAQGLSGATVHLETLWNRFCETEALCLFCAYPKAGFTQDVSSSMHTICCTHSKIISGEHDSKSQILYRPTLKTAG
jgi:hypothetical protein